MLGVDEMKLLRVILELAYDWCFVRFILKVGIRGRIEGIFSGAMQEEECWEYLGHDLA